MLQFQTSIVSDYHFSFVWMSVLDRDSLRAIHVPSASIPLLNPFIDFFYCYSSCFLIFLRSLTFNTIIELVSHTVYFFRIETGLTCYNKCLIFELRHFGCYDSMEYYMKQQHFLIGEHYYKMVKVCCNSESVYPLFGSNNVPNSSTEKRIIEKFEGTGSVVDLNHTTRARSGRMSINIAAVPDSGQKSRDFDVFKNWIFNGHSSPYFHQNF